MAIIENYKMRIGWERIGHFPTNFSFSQQIATNCVSEFSMHRIGKTTMPYTESSPGLRAKATAKALAHSIALPICNPNPTSKVLDAPGPQVP